MLWKISVGLGIVADPAGSSSPRPRTSPRTCRACKSSPTEPLFPPTGRTPTWTTAPVREEPENTQTTLVRTILNRWRHSMFHPGSARWRACQRRDETSFLITNNRVNCITRRFLWLIVYRRSDSIDRGYATRNYETNHARLNFALICHAMTWRLSLLS